jgi:hypothetical protein
MVEAGGVEYAGEGPSAALSGAYWDPSASAEGGGLLLLLLLPATGSLHRSVEQHIRLVKVSNAVCSS